MHVTGQYPYQRPPPIRGMGAPYIRPPGPPRPVAMPIPPQIGKYIYSRLLLVYRPQYLL